jgi:hypothetical protein
MEVSGQLHASAALPPGEEHLLMDRRFGGPQSRSVRGGEEENSQPLTGFEPPTIQPVAQRYTTELSRLNCAKPKKKTSRVLLGLFNDVHHMSNVFIE